MSVICLRNRKKASVAGAWRAVVTAVETLERNARSFIRQPHSQDLAEVIQLVTGKARISLHRSLTLPSPRSFQGTTVNRSYSSLRMEPSSCFKHRINRCLLNVYRKKGKSLTTYACHSSSQFWSEKCQLTLQTLLNTHGRLLAFAVEILNLAQVVESPGSPKILMPESPTPRNSELCVGMNGD